MENLGKSFHVMECRVMECHGTVMECNGMSCHGMSWYGHGMSWYGHGMSCNLRIWEDHGISFHVMENQGKSFHVMECRVMECNVMVRSWNVITAQLTMKAYSIALAAVVVVLLSLILSTCLNRAQAEGRTIPQLRSSSSVSTMASSYQAFKDLQADKNHPFKKVDSSFGRIPPSTWNPINNK
ncbi:hypothetical protein LWI29_033846 [Acer saccharum]|uniref:Uncharacterized protein n=1 Tax=Acer saccharum TaxID=4024 RepID=A0AA39SJQ6_ACESA|nr:hypothetical protein LWI29_033846 [Acer saccharum]